ncbi:MAG: chemotaxis protein CheC [Candidatus Rokubacteria bacterium]|nr:chemotaxis protein CheC [Candidatus Rokubacteria bacterium]
MTTPKGAPADMARFAQEVGQVGSEHAAQALSVLLRHSVQVAALRALTLSAVELNSLSRLPGDVFFGVYFNLQGKSLGQVLVMISRAHACRLVDMVSDKPQGATTVLDESGLSAIREVSNILVGSYLGAARALVKVPLLHSIPFLAMDQWETILNSLIPALAETQKEKITVIESELSAQGSEVRCWVLLVVGDWWQ